MLGLSTRQLVGVAVVSLAVSFIILPMLQKKAT